MPRINQTQKVLTYFQEKVDKNTKEVSLEGNGIFKVRLYDGKENYWAIYNYNSKGISYSLNNPRKLASYTYLMKESKRGYRVHNPFIGDSPLFEEIPKHCIGNVYKIKSRNLSCYLDIKLMQHSNWEKNQSNHEKLIDKKIFLN